MDPANTVIEISSRGTKTKAGEIGNLRKSAGKDACDYGLADSDSHSTSDGTENVEPLVELNDMMFMNLPQKHEAT